MAGSVGVGGGTGIDGVDGAGSNVSYGNRSVRTRSGVGETSAGMLREHVGERTQEGVASARGEEPP